MQNVKNAKPKKVQPKRKLKAPLKIENRDDYAGNSLQTETVNQIKRCKTTS
jgi:hypothetical protein